MEGTSHLVAQMLKIADLQAHNVSQKVVRFYSFINFLSVSVFPELTLNLYETVPFPN